jgi:hypothetical protein
MIKRIIKRIIDLLDYLQARRTYRKNHMCWKHNCYKSFNNYGSAWSFYICTMCIQGRENRKYERLEKAKQRRGL